MAWNRCNTLQPRPLRANSKTRASPALLKRLAATSDGLCVVTTRYAIPDLRAFIGKNLHEEKLTRLSTDAGVALLQSFGVKGSFRKTIPSPDGRTHWNEFEKLVEDVKGHALTLNLLGSFLRDSHAGDIRRRDLIKLEEADAEEQGGHAFHVMDACVKSFESGGKTAEDNAKGRLALALLRLLGLFDRPATADCLDALWKGEAIAGLTEPLMGISEAQRNMSLKRLEDAKLLTENRDASHRLVSLDAHPLLREYFAKRLRKQQPKAWRASHRRLYEHLCTTTKEGEQPTLEDLQPLYQAVAHGCQAGMQQDALYKVGRDRIRRGDEEYATRKLGAFGSSLGAIACFFEIPWSRVSPSLTEVADKAWLLTGAAYCLRALGRTTEAIEPMRAGLDMRIKLEDWKNAAISASYLSELELALGEVAGAVGDAEQSVIYADRSSDAFWKMGTRTVQAGALHQAGHGTDAEARFREAEQMQAERQPDCPLLYGIAGFRYCDLLLTKAERAAWQTLLCGSRCEKDHSENRSPTGEGESHYQRLLKSAATSVESCRAVSDRAAQTLKIAERNNWLLETALDHLTVGRAALYVAILKSRGSAQISQYSSLGLSTEDLGGLRSAAQQIHATVAGFRRCGITHQIPRGLVTRAWLRSLTGPRTGTESAQSDLDEAWEIAERGPIRLFLADIHLHRARLFHAETPYPWKSSHDDLAKARQHIEKHGYSRRIEELEDAEQALGVTRG